MQRVPDSEADRLVNGQRVEIKLSTRWASGIYKFQQIRDQDYDLIAMLGISPHAVHLWVARKQTVYARATGQHTGQDGHDTRWVSFPVDAPPEWLGAHGGSLDAGLTRLAPRR